MAQKGERASLKRQLDCREVSRAVWLVKVPKYLSERWQQSAGLPEVGRLKILDSGVPAAKKEVLFRLNDNLVTKPSTGESASAAAPLAPPIPQEHKFIVSPIQNQTLAVLSEDKTGSLDLDGEVGRVSACGRVVQKAECRPTESGGAYMKLKVQMIEEQSRPQRYIQQVERAEIKFKPVAKHLTDLKLEKEKKEVGRSARLEKHQLRDIIFQAFEKHQYYNISDLQRLTNQPYTFLKEVLVEVCQYNSAPPHRNMWELKPEYRHYK